MRMVEMGYRPDEELSELERAQQDVDREAAQDVVREVQAKAGGKWVAVVWLPEDPADVSVHVVGLGNVKLPELHHADGVYPVLSWNVEGDETYPSVPVVMRRPEEQVINGLWVWGNTAAAWEVTDTEAEGEEWLAAWSARSD